MTNNDKMITLTIAAVMGASVIGIAAYTDTAGIIADPASNEIVDDRVDSPPAIILDCELWAGYDSPDVASDVRLDACSTPDGISYAPDAPESIPAPETQVLPEAIPAPSTWVPTEQDNGSRPDWNHLQPCEHEDSTYNCFWDAETRGNGEGMSFVVIDGTPYYMITDGVQY